MGWSAGSDQKDRRQIVVCLTDEGEELIRELFPSHAQNIADLMSILTPVEQEQLGRLCKMLGRQMRVEEPAPEHGNPGGAGCVQCKAEAMPEER